MDVYALLAIIFLTNATYIMKKITLVDNSSLLEVTLDEMDVNQATYYQHALRIMQRVSAINSQKDIIKLDITNSDAEIWRFPNFSTNGFDQTSIPINNSLFSYTQQPYSFIIDNHFAFLNQVILGNHFSNFSFELSKSKVFGFGEKVGPLFLGDNYPLNIPHTYTFFNKDQQSPISMGETGKNVYSTHPFGLFYDKKTGMFSGVYYRSSNAFDLNVLQSESTTKIEFISTCNYIELYLFTKSKSLEYIVQNYHTLIGRPYLPPFWSLGYHACNWGWKTVNDLENVFNGYEKSKMPVDAIWSDIDYMNDYEDFTVNDQRFPKLIEFTTKLHENGVRYVPIIDAGVKTKKDSIYTLKGYEDDCFIKSAITNRPLEGTVWPGNANFLDWFNPNATKLWHMGLSNLKQKALFDGIWLDMNEVANFCDAECPGHAGNEIPYTPKNSQYFDIKNHAQDEFSHLSKVPGNKPLYSFTISMEGYHYSTSTKEDIHLKQFNTHNLNGMMSTKATSDYFVSNKIRPFILTRSSFPGTGQFSSKWLGDNFATWDYLKYSISGMVEFSLYGIPHIGADFCGFMGHASQSLCVAWYMVGALYPFSRNHHDSNRDPYRPIYSMVEAEKLVIKFAFYTKYSLSHYYYTALANIHINGGTLIRSLFYQFPSDEKVWNYTESSFMVSDGILIYAKLSESNNLNVYLPNWNWYDFYTFNKVKQFQPNNMGQELIVDCSAKLPLYIRGGYIIPYHSISDAKRISESINMPIELIIALDHNFEAIGSYFVDDGVEAESIENGHYSMYSMNFSNNILSVSSSIHNNTLTLESEYLSVVEILGSNVGDSITKACVYFMNSTYTLVDIANANGVITVDVDKILLYEIQKIKIANTCENAL